MTVGVEVWVGVKVVVGVGVMVGVAVDVEVNVGADGVNVGKGAALIGYRTSTVEKVLPTLTLTPY